MITVGGLDLETTGLEQPKGHRIIEVALKVFNLETRQPLGAYVTRVNPQRPIDPDAEAIHHIRFEDVAVAPLWEEVAPKLSALMARCNYIVAHNGQGFDIPFVSAEFARIGVSVPRVALMDTLLQGRWATPDGAVPRLQALCFACGVDYDPSLAHAALYDVDRMMDCFFSQFDRGFFKLPRAEFETEKLREAA